MIQKGLIMAWLLLLSQSIRAQELTYKFDSLSLKVYRTVQLEDGGTDTVSCSRYHHFVWFDENSETARKLNSMLYADLSEAPIQSIQDLKEILKSDFDDWSKEWEAQFTAEDTAPIDYSFSLNWFEETQIGITHQTPSILCTFESNQGYYGGAHPINGGIYRVFELPSIKRIENWQDLFTDSTKIISLAEESFRYEKSLKPNTNLKKAGYWFKNDHFHVTNNFGFDVTGLVFYFNVYEVSCYAEGPIYISIPYAKIKKYLKKPL